MRRSCLALISVFAAGCGGGGEQTGGDAGIKPDLAFADASNQQDVAAPVDAGEDTPDAVVINDGGGPDAPAPDGRDAGADGRDASASKPDLPPCDGATTLSLVESQAYVQMAVGDRWSYRGTFHREGSPDREFNNQITVTGTDVVDGKPVFVVTDSTPGGQPGTATHYLEVSGGLVDHGEDVPSADPVAIAESPAFPELAFPITTCAPYEQFTMPYNNGTLTSTAIELGFEPRTVKAGTFTDTLHHQRILTTGRQTMTVSDWIAPHVGRVQRAVHGFSYDYSYELLGAYVGGVGRGLVSLDQIAHDLAVDPAPFGPDRPVVASDGSRFLVVQATNTGYYQGGLQGVVVGAKGDVVNSTPLLTSASRAPRDPAVAFGGGHYLVTYEEINQSTLWGLFVSPAGAPEGPPFAVSQIGTTASIAFGGGAFLVAHPGVSSIVVDIVKSDGTAAIETTPISAKVDDAAGVSIAFDGTNFLIAFGGYVSGSTTADAATHTTVARIDAQARLLDAAPTIVSQETDVDESVDVAFDGTQYVVAWFHRPDRSLLGQGTIRAARVGMDGSLLDGPPSPAGGHALSFTDSGRDHPRVGRLGAGAIVVWEHKRVADFVYRVVGTRLDKTGAPLDTSSTDEGLWISSAFPSLPAIAFAGDRTLVVSALTGGNHLWKLGDALLFPF